MHRVTLEPVYANVITCVTPVPDGRLRGKFLSDHRQLKSFISRPSGSRSFIPRVHLTDEARSELISRFSFPLGRAEMRTDTISRFFRAIRENTALGERKLAKNSDTARASFETSAREDRAAALESFRGEYKAQTGPQRSRASVSRVFGASLERARSPERVSPARRLFGSFTPSLQLLLRRLIPTARQLLALHHCATALRNMDYLYFRFCSPSLSLSLSLNMVHLIFTSFDFARFALLCFAFHFFLSLCAAVSKAI